MVRTRHNKDSEKAKDKPIEIEWVESDPQRKEHVLISKNIKNKGCDDPTCHCNRFSIKMDKYGWSMATLPDQSPDPNDSLITTLLKAAILSQPIVVCLNAPLDHCKKVAQQILDNERKGE